MNLFPPNIDASEYIQSLPDLLIFYIFINIFTKIKFKKRNLYINT